ncbi:MAG: hypothetical protein M0P43_02525 [Arcobacteraceae bacterium]|jgi:hypothetical protein|nr:hypothetical protein [Arcobacteraceae bacterium]MDY0328663.1 hypothetical protein [Arcobacteraceae bacterium]
MFFIFDTNNPKTILFYVFMIVVALVIDYLGILEIKKTIAIFMLIGIGLYFFYRGFR